MSQGTTHTTGFTQGGAVTSSELLPLVYEELRRLASAKLRDNPPGQTLQPTALVHEAFLRLVDGHPEVRWENRNHFLGAAAEAMRRILIERARQRVTQKAGGDRGRISLEEAVASVEDRPLDLLALNEALTELEGHDRQAAELVKLRFFAGFGHAEAAEIMQIERRAADRLWVLARSWLFRRLTNP